VKERNGRVFKRKKGIYCGERKRVSGFFMHGEGDERGGFLLGKGGGGHTSFVLERETHLNEIARKD